MIYVDTLIKHPPAKEAQARRVGARNGNQWCHLFCDPGEEEALHAFATGIGMRREWFQPSPPASKPHYDLTPPRRSAAVRRGAVELDRDGLRAFFARWRDHYQRSAGTTGVVGPSAAGASGPQE